MQGLGDTGTTERSLLDGVRRHWYVIVLTVVGFGVAAAVAGALGPSYRATASLLLEDPRSTTVFNPSTSTPDEGFVADQLSVVRSSVVATEAREVLQSTGVGSGLTVRDLLDAVSASAGSSPRVVLVSFTADSEAVATAGADAFVQAYRVFRRRDARQPLREAIAELDEEITRLDASLTEIDGRLVEASESLGLTGGIEGSLERLAGLEEEREAASSEELPAIQDAIANELAKIQALASTGEVGGTELSSLVQQRDSLVERRTPLVNLRDELAVDAELIDGGVTVLSSGQVEPALGGILGTSLVGAVLGLIFGVGAVTILSARPGRFASPFQPEAVLGAPLLAVVPRPGRDRPDPVLPVVEDPDSPAAEAFRFIAARRWPRSGFTQDAVPGTGEVVMFTPAASSEGRSYVTANVGTAAALSGSKVLVVDACFESQGLTTLMTGGQALDSSRWISLESSDDGGPSMVEFPVEGKGRLVLATGTGVGWAKASPPVLDVEASEAFLKRARGEFDLIVVDGSPVTEAPYAATLASYADTVVLVVRPATPFARVSSIRRKFELLDVPVAGYVYDERRRGPHQRDTAESSPA